MCPRKISRLIQMRFAGKEKVGHARHHGARRDGEQCTGCPSQRFQLYNENSTKVLDSFRSVLEVGSNASENRHALKGQTSSVHRKRVCESVYLKTKA